MLGLRQLSEVFKFLLFTNYKFVVGSLLTSFIMCSAVSQYSAIHTTQHAGVTYSLYSPTASFSSAKQHCISKNRVLWFPPTIADEGTLYQDLTSGINCGLYSCGVWINLTDDETEDTWLLEDRTTPSYTHWLSQSRTSLQNCAVLYSNGWEDDYCDDSYHYICASSPPACAAAAVAGSGSTGADSFRILRSRFKKHDVNQCSCGIVDDSCSTFDVLEAKLELCLVRCVKLGALCTGVMLHNGVPKMLTNNSTVGSTIMDANYTECYLKT